MTHDTLDPKGLVREAYRIEGITIEECRSVFLDWALSLPDTLESTKAIAVLLERHGDEPADHPMTRVLAAGRDAPTTPKRRGGWRARSR
ncbi:hypothetical protein [Roseovarius sp. SYSU LYC5161]|uniref:hypothetical protein n=1 Tax=Roseovarius halophilus (ex Wu et al. 2025) TaxID=3376060 RepID=UPI002871041B|nr:hypothetical protein [Roseovarius sp.]